MLLDKTVVLENGKPRAGILLCEDRPSRKTLLLENTKISTSCFPADTDRLRKLKKNPRGGSQELSVARLVLFHACSFFVVSIEA